MKKVYVLLLLTVGLLVALPAAAGGPVQSNSISLEDYYETKICAQEEVINGPDTIWVNQISGLIHVDEMAAGIPAGSIQAPDVLFIDYANTGREVESFIEMQIVGYSGGTRGGALQSAGFT